MTEPAARLPSRRLLIWSAMVGAVAIAAAFIMTPARLTAAPVPPTRLGINLPGLAYWVETRSFTNLAIYGDLIMVTPDDKRTAIDPAMLGANGWPSAVPADIRIFLRILLPPTAKRGDVIHCSWRGKATITVLGIPMIGGDASNLFFRLNADAPDSVHGTPGQGALAILVISNTSPADPLADLDCREPDTPRAQLFDPAFIQSLRPYRVVRFMDWMSANNAPVADFARETMPERPRSTHDGVTLSSMIALAIEAKVDPWFTIPYDAGDDYIRRFAQMTHDRLPPNRTVYVELSNEVWNLSFIAARQAQAEGLKAGLSTNPGEAQLFQYALKSKHMLDIWTRVYADRPDRLVRVVSSQNFNPASSMTILGYRDVAKSVDALATAPYFGLDLYPRPNRGPRPANLDQAFAQLQPMLDQTLDLARRQKAVAQKFGKRFIAYEAGQHVLIPDNPDLLRTINRDPRMGVAYTRFLQAWSQDIGDTIALFSQLGPVSQWGAWGLQEYDGQPLSETPKKKAVLDFAAAHRATGQ